jgi:hypothetical protein
VVVCEILLDIEQGTRVEVVVAKPWDGLYEVEECAAKATLSVSMI